MKPNSFMEKLTNTFSWIARLAYAHFLWMFFSVAGLVVFGIFPATAALMTVCRNWLDGEESVPVFRTFWTSYRSSFFAVNKIGLAYMAGALILYLNFLAIQENGAGIVMVAAFYLSVFFLVITGTHLLPLYVVRKQSFLYTWKTAFVMSIVNLPISIAVLISQSAIYYLLFSYPSAALFFLSSTLVMIQLWLVQHSFNHIEKKAAALRDRKSASPVQKTHTA
ncbi:DUF624 domain-containing protein [Domibacillus sp. PGB-M46]|uniref:YesL family protein n=1 Tax=Domibacillus sp. PGB-M46 TaxID=2910255 RepID=UPI001F59F39B|nr:DUF624 domain-containing protein [Domibacillus sp. PGB-M46]MCI2256951.1 DUF624 domain-containing protein [Domibacillus sp. PGB-M46]